MDAKRKENGRTREGSPASGRSGYVRATVAEQAGYVPGEQPTEDGVIKLNTNENPYPPSDRVRDAIVEASERLRLYPDPTARALRQCVGQLYAVDPEGVVVGNGSDELLTLLVRAVVDPGEAVAYPVPTYTLYDALVALQGGRAFRVPFPDDFSLPQGLFEARARMIIICNPNAPSGTAVSTSALERLATAREDAVVVVDEAYVDFADENATSLVGRLPNVVVLRTLSKSYSLAGLRVGFALTTPDLARELAKLKDSYNVSRLAQAGALAALRDQDTMRAHVEQVRATRRRLSRALEGMGFSVLPSQANFIWVRRPGQSLANVAAVLKTKGILVRYFTDLPDALRITVGSDREIDALLGRLAELEI